MPEQRPLDLNELARRIENLVRVGTVAEVDLVGTRCRVRSGALHTQYLPFFARRAGDVRHWSPVSTGEQCIVFAPGGDLAAGMVLVGLYSDTIAAPEDSATAESTTYPDGAVVRYDHAAHALTAVLPGGGTADITAPASVKVHSQAITLDAPQTTTTGRLTVLGLLTYAAGMNGTGVGVGAAAVINGSVQTTGDVVAGGISLQGHKHDGVQTGSGSTGGPQ